MFGDVVLCRFPFTSGAAAKVRPALALFDLGHDVIIARIMSVARGGPLEVALTDWQAAGLLERLTTFRELLVGSEFLPMREVLFAALRRPVQRRQRKRRAFRGGSFSTRQSR